MNKLQFHSFEALRFFAFLKVYLLHVPIQGNFPVFSFLKQGGGIGVAFFFVLSGFLITYLLVNEKIQKGQINAKKFLIRRTLRIWPLFYLMLIIVTILPYDFKQAIGFHMVGGGYDLDWRYSFTFLENYKTLLLDRGPKTTPLPVFWSLCIEIHFYIIWIICFRFIKTKHLFKFLLACFVVAWISRFFEPYIYNNTRIFTNDIFTNLDYFASGGILGYLVAKDYKKVAHTIKSIPLNFRWLILASILIIVLFQKYILPHNPGTIFCIFRPTIIALLFTSLLAIFIPQDSEIKINSRFLGYLGARSYGLYVYHIAFVHVVFQYYIYQGIKIDDWLALGTYIVITLGGSIIVSILSFKYFELKMLALRPRS